MGWGWHDDTWRSGIPYVIPHQDVAFEISGIMGLGEYKIRTRPACIIKLLELRSLDHKIRNLAFLWAEDLANVTSWPSLIKRKVLSLAINLVC